MNFLMKLITGVKKQFSVKKAKKVISGKVLGTVSSVSPTAARFAGMTQDEINNAIMDHKLKKVRIINTRNSDVRKAYWNDLSKEEKIELGRRYDSGEWERWSEQPEAVEGKELLDYIAAYK